MAVEAETVPIRNPELVDVVFRVQQAESKQATAETLSNKNRIKSYDAALLAWTDAEDMSRRLISGNQVRLENTLGHAYADLSIS